MDSKTYNANGCVLFAEALILNCFSAPQSISSIKARNDFAENSRILSALCNCKDVDERKIRNAIKKYNKKSFELAWDKTVKRRLEKNKKIILADQ